MNVEILLKPVQIYVESLQHPNAAWSQRSLAPGLAAKGLRDVKFIGNYHVDQNPMFLSLTRYFKRVGCKTRGIAINPLILKGLEGKGNIYIWGSFLK